MTVIGRRLFHRLILLSGSVLSPWSIPRDTVAQSMALADRLNCSTAASRVQLGSAGTPDRALVVQCLRRVAVERLVRAADRGSDGDVWTPARYGPTLGTAGAGVLPGGSVEQLMNDACSNRFIVAIALITS